MASVSLAGTWDCCDVGQIDGPIWIKNAQGSGISAGMSGSPIVYENGAAIGAVCIGTGSNNAKKGGPNPHLLLHLPGWIVRGAIST